jgi:hypothetical protein
VITGFETASGYIKAGCRYHFHSNKCINYTNKNTIALGDGEFHTMLLRRVPFRPSSLGGFREIGYREKLPNWMGMKEYRSFCTKEQKNITEKRSFLDLLRLW